MAVSQVWQKKKKKKEKVMMMMMMMMDLQHFEVVQADEGSSGDD